MHDEAREQEMHGNEWTGETSEEAKKRYDEAEKYLDVAGEAACERVAVLCGMTYGDVVRAYFALGRHKLVMELLVSEAENGCDIAYEGGHIPVKLHDIELIDEMHFRVTYGDELRTMKPVKTRDGGQRKGWQTCYGPAQRRSSTKSKDWRTWTAGRKR